MEVKKYQDAELDPRILRAVEELGFENMTPIQEQAIPVLLEKKDVLGQAQTGTGKTAAFGLPLIQNIDPENRNLQAIVLCPTRELAIQAAEEMRRFAKYMQGIRILPIYGGQEISRQIRALKGGVHIVVGTPGRVMDHMRRHTLKMEQVNMVVLDEADEMLNMGFREDIETILKGIPKEHQTALFSATMPAPILEITHVYQKDAVHLKMTKQEVTIPLVKQYFYRVMNDTKVEVTSRLLDYYGVKRSLVFCNTKRQVDELAEILKNRGYAAEGLHGDLSQGQRDTVMNRFRTGNLQILIATDVAARGIDVDDVEAVVNFDLPQDIEYYVHRIGRTGRAGREGRSFTLVSNREMYRLREIERSCKTTIQERRVPSVSDIVSIRAEKALREAFTVLEAEELAGLAEMVERKLAGTEYGAAELAAAFLRLQMGEEPQEIPEIRSAGYRREGRRYGTGRSGNTFQEERLEGGKRSGEKRRASRSGERFEAGLRRPGQTLPRGGSRRKEELRSGQTDGRGYERRSGKRDGKENRRRKESGVRGDRRIG